MNKKLYKARKMLDSNKYHLCIEFDGITLKWELFEIYETWMDDGSKPVMTSETHTEEDLIKFAKEHRTYKFVDICKVLVIISLVNLAILILGIVTKNGYLRNLVTGSNLCIILLSIIVGIMDTKNFKVNCLELKAKIRREKERWNKKYESKRKDN